MKMYEFSVKRKRLSRKPPVEITGTAAAAELAMSLIGAADREYMLALYLDAHCQCVGFETVAIGGIASVETHPRETFRGAILAGAASLVLAHNHPSGNPNPSANDRIFAARMMECGMVLGIPVNESIVVTDKEWRAIPPMGMMEQLLHCSAADSGER